MKIPPPPTAKPRLHVTTVNVRSGREPCRPSRYFGWKRLLDVTLASLFLIPALPIMLVAMLAVVCTSKGPAIYRQTRVGRHGRKFVMYKIRSMRADAERDSGPVWAKTGDPRVTTVGQIVRRLHIDELPQLFNVLAGDMSLVGPRPERPEFTHSLALSLPGYQDRHLVLPGITGLAQINLPPDTDLDSVRRKLSLDLQYVEKGSAMMDFGILSCTFLRLIGLRGKSIRRAFGLDREFSMLAVEETLHVPPPARRWGTTVGRRLLRRRKDTVSTLP